MRERRPSRFGVGAGTPSGEVRPGKGGLVVGLRHLPALAEALASALADHEGEWPPSP